jgi:hypothetical protein
LLLAQLAILALVSLVVTASHCGSDDLEQLAIHFSADHEQASETLVVDGAHDGWDVELTATSCACAGQHQVLQNSDVRSYRSSMAGHNYSTAYVDNSVKAAYCANPHRTTDA